MKQKQKVADEIKGASETHQPGWNCDFVPLTMDDYLDGCDNNIFPIENHGDASFTGVWTSSKTFLCWLEKNYNRVLKLDSTPSSASTSAPSAFKILELGSGTGWVSINLAKNLQRYCFDTNDHVNGNCNCNCNCNSNDNGNTDNTTANRSMYQVVLSDSDKTGAFQWTKANLQKAVEEGYFDANNNVSLDVIPFDWSNSDHRHKVSAINDWDLIFGTDLIYSEDGCINLVKSMSTLLIQMSINEKHARSGHDKVMKSTFERKRKIIYGHTSGRMPHLDKQFESDLENHDLQWKILEKLPLPLWNKDDRTTTIFEISLLCFTDDLQ